MTRATSKPATKTTKKPTAADKAKVKAVVERAEKGAARALASTKSSKPKFDASALYSDTMDAIEKRQGYESSGLDVAPPMSTSLLCYDLLLGGGIRPCMMTGAGNEQSSKTTLALVVMAAAITEDIPIIAFADFEGSTKNSKPYVASILQTCGVKMNVDQVFGKKGSDGKWIHKPRVRYRSQVILERFYDWMSEILRDLPDKRYVEGKWWLVFEDNKKNKMKVADFTDANMTRKYGNGYWVEAPDGKMQGIVFIDSYTAMNPEVKDEEAISNQLSVKASAFSKQLERIKGRMANKMVTVYGLNHLRANPMAMFGPKEEEKGGQALRQFSDVRVRQTTRSLSAVKEYGPVANKKFNEAEPSVEFPGTQDEYRYVHLKTNKNKLWTPHRETFIRLWVEDGDGKARGVDPVFDVIQYLKTTGQLSGRRKAFKIDLKGLGVSKPVTWQDIKLWVLGDRAAMTSMSKKAGFKPMNLKSFLHKQVKSGLGDELFVKNKNSKAKKLDDDDSGTED